MTTPPNVDISRRLADLETRLESAFELDARLKSIERDLSKRTSSSLRDWIHTLGPYVSGMLVFVIGYMIKDSVTLALQREQLNLDYVKEMRDLVKDFDEAQTQSAADANAVGLSMFGRHAVLPLVERLRAGDVVAIAAERGLELVGATDQEGACPKFLAVLQDRGRRYTWQTHKTLVRITAQSECAKALPVLQQYRASLKAAGTDRAKLASFATRYAESADFDAEGAAGLVSELDGAIALEKGTAAP